MLSGSKISAFNEYIQRLSQILIFMSYAGSSEISAHTYITVHSYHLKDSRNKSAKRRWIFKLKADIFSRIPFNNVPKRYPSRFFLFFSCMNFLNYDFHKFITFMLFFFFRVFIFSWRCTPESRWYVLFIFISFVFHKYIFEIIIHGNSILFDNLFIVTFNDSYIHNCLLR